MVDASVRRADSPTPGVDEIPQRDVCISLQPQDTWWVGSEIVRII